MLVINLIINFASVIISNTGMHANTHARIHPQLVFVFCPRRHRQIAIRKGINEYLLTYFRMHFPSEKRGENIVARSHNPRNSNPQKAN